MNALMIGGILFVGLIIALATWSQTNTAEATSMDIDSEETKQVEEEIISGDVEPEPAHIQTEEEKEAELFYYQEK